jgi:hypothetical protein
MERRERDGRCKPLRLVTAETQRKDRMERADLGCRMTRPRASEAGARGAGQEDGDGHGAATTGHGRNARGRLVEEREQRVLERRRRSDHEQIRRERTHHDRTHVMPRVDRGLEDLHVERRVVVAEDGDLQDEQGRRRRRERDLARPRRGGRGHQRKHERDGCRCVEQRARRRKPGRAASKQHIEHHELPREERTRERSRDRCTSMHGEGRGKRQAGRIARAARCGPRW